MEHSMNTCQREFYVFVVLLFVNEIFSVGREDWCLVAAVQYLRYTVTVNGTVTCIPKMNYLEIILFSSQGKQRLRQVYIFLYLACYF